MSRLALTLLALLAGCGSSQHPPRRPKPTCLVLSVGGTAGLAHLGALEALRARRVEFSCVVGNSMGALVGALYAAHPERDTTAEYRRLVQAYERQTRREAGERAAGLGVLGLLLLGPLGGLAGAAAGAATVDPLEHARLVAVLDRHLRGATIDALPVRFRTSYFVPHGTGLTLVEAHHGSLADAVGGSIANPLAFPDVDVRRGTPIDPGLDRVAAVPLEQACENFPGARLLAINVTADPAFVSSRMHCPSTELQIAVPARLTARAAADAPALRKLVELGRSATEAWLETPAGRGFLDGSRRDRTISPSRPLRAGRTGATDRTISGQL